MYTMYVLAKGEVCQKRNSKNERSNAKRYQCKQRQNETEIGQTTEIDE